jgi:hypothetical protein
MIRCAFNHADTGTGTVPNRQNTPADCLKLAPITNTSVPPCSGPRAGTTLQWITQADCTVRRFRHGASTEYHRCTSSYEPVRMYHLRFQIATQFEAFRAKKRIEYVQRSVYKRDLSVPVNFSQRYVCVADAICGPVLAIQCDFHTHSSTRVCKSSRGDLFHGTRW